MAGGARRLFTQCLFDNDRAEGSFYLQPGVLRPLCGPARRIDEFLPEVGANPQPYRPGQRAQSLGDVRAGVQGDR